MLSASSRVMGTQARVASRQLRSAPFHSYSKVFQEALVKSTPPPPPVKKIVVKKTHPFNKFLFRLILATTIFYGGGAYLSLQNDTFNDYFTEYVPLADEVVQAIEDNKKFFTESDLKELQKKVSELKDKTVTVNQEGAISEKINDFYQQVKTKTSKDSTTPIEAKNVVSENRTLTVAKLNIPTIDYSSNNEDVDLLIKKLNTFIKSINESNPNESFSKIIENVNASVVKISNSIKEFEASKDKLIEEVKEKTLKNQEIDLKSKENELTKEFLNKYNLEIESIKKVYEKQLTKDIEINKQTLELEYENKLKASQIYQLKEIEKIINEKIENERNGKLKNLEKLFEKVEALEKFEIELGKNFTKFNKFNEILIHLNNLKKIVHSETYQNNLSEINGQKIINEINEISKLTVNDKESELLNIIIKSLPIDSIKSAGLISNAQLTQRWNLLAPELRSASLLPPNAGLLGHLSAKFFSYILISKNGNVDDAIGNDIESVISRVNYKLSNGDLDDAIEIVSNLKGWSRKLSNDWLIEARKKLELEFLVDLIDTEIKYSY